MVGKGYTWSFGLNWLASFENADFQSIFAGNAPAVTPSKKSINPNRKSTTGFPVSLIRGVYDTCSRYTLAHVRHAAQIVYIHLPDDYDIRARMPDTGIEFMAPISAAGFWSVCFICL